MRNANALSILNYLRTNGVSTRREIQAATGLSWATVSTITADLIAQDILIEKAPKERVSGRTPTLLDFNPRKNMSIGAEINVEGLTVVLLDLRGKVISAQEELLDQAEKHSTLNQITRMIEEILHKNHLQKKQLLGIGVSVQGSVDKEGSVSLYNHYIKDWRDVPLKDLFEDYFGVPVRVMQKIFDDAGRYMGIGIANLINLLNPRYVVLTGGVLDISDRMVKQTKEYACKNAWHISSFDIIITKESRRRASMGAALNFINEAFESQESVLLRKP